MTITLNDGEVDLIIEIIGESLPDDADKATNPIECNLLDRLIELRNLAQQYAALRAKGVSDGDKL